MQQLHPRSDEHAIRRDKTRLGGTDSDIQEPRLEELLPREREIAKIVLRRRMMSLREIEWEVSDAGLGSTVRSIVRRLVDKGVLRRRQEGRRSLYLPADGTSAKETPRRRPMRSREYNSARPELRRLPPREREVAILVHSQGEMTPGEIELGLSDVISNSAIRTMLRRLVAKGILERRKDGNKFFYFAAASEADAREQALRRLADQYFERSLYRTMVALLDLLLREQPPSLPAGVQAAGSWPSLAFVNPPMSAGSRGGGSAERLSATSRHR